MASRIISNSRSSRGLAFPWAAVVQGAFSVGQMILGGEMQRSRRERARERARKRKALQRQAQQMAAQERSAASQLSEEAARRVIESNARKTYREALTRLKRVAEGLPTADMMARTAAEQVRSARLAGAQEAAREGRLKKTVLGGLGAFAAAGAGIMAYRHLRGETAAEAGGGDA